MNDLEPFLSRLAGANPFVDNRVNGPADPVVDVPEIHRRAFTQLQEHARTALDTRRGIGAMLGGEAGIGKSHLLARLSRWARDEGRSCFIYLHNFQASPEHLPRTLLRAITSVLTGGRIDHFRKTDLFRLVAAFVKEALQYDPARTYSWTEASRAYDSLVNDMLAQDPSQAVVIDRQAYEVLYRFFESAKLASDGGGDEESARLALRWLSGDFLDEGEARLLQLRRSPRPAEALALGDSHEIKQVLVALSRMAASWGRPFILCFDQVDNLDIDQAAALARFLEALFDSSSNLFVVVAGIQATLLHWRQRKVIQDSAWDRLAQFEVALQRINPEEGKALIHSRLQKFMAPFEAIGPIQRIIEQDSLFPLGRRWFDDTLGGKAEARPREMLSRAREHWRWQQGELARLGPDWLNVWDRLPDTNGHPPIVLPMEWDAICDRKIEEKMREHIAKRQEDGSLPADAANLAGLVVRLVEHCQRGAPSANRLRLETSDDKGRQIYDFIVSRPASDSIPSSQVGLVFLVTENANSAGACLRKLVQDRRPPDRILLVTDERKPLRLGTKGQEYYDELAQSESRFRHVVLSFADHAKLDALQAIVGMARAGDLEIDVPGGRSSPLTEEDVIASHRRQNRYKTSAILGEILTDQLEPVHTE